MSGNESGVSYAPMQTQDVIDKKLEAGGNQKLNIDPDLLKEFVQTSGDERAAKLGELYYQNPSTGRFIGKSGQYTDFGNDNAAIGELYKQYLAYQGNKKESAAQHADYVNKKLERPGRDQTILVNQDMGSNNLLGF